MSSKVTRRDILKHALAGTALALAKPVTVRSSLNTRGERTVRIGMVEVGSRGTSLLQTLMALEGVEVKALADINVNNLARAQGIVEKKCGMRPEGYAAGPEDFRRLVIREDLDAVITATPWEWHETATKYVCIFEPVYLASKA